MATGTVKWFSDDKGFGFIRTDEGERLQVDGPGFAVGERPEGRCAEMVVTFEVEESEEGRRAQNVVFERQVAARRARLRGSGRGVTR